MTSKLNTPWRTRLMVVLLLAVTFLAGGASGAALERRASAEPSRQEQKDRLEEPEEREDDEGRENQRRRRSIFDHIDLAPEQRTAIDSILQAGQERVAAYWKEWEPGYRALLDSTRAQVRMIMTPEQQAKYDRIRAEHRARLRAREQEATSKGNSSGGEGVIRGTSYKGGDVFRWGKGVMEDRGVSGEARTE